ncbi:hypothetical protein TSUD_331090 [Trifolium subterraneum]|uniref:Uncharacterized protein n=1 Tax=Trifolium subterraneum TaxID=3900 RepID=A0A2Z6MD23_TRISU|nr:hypothetical protein TSUD_331090 [Trifolium subterraneum]
MGGNMALLRSSIEGDVERLLRSKKDSMKYYFSELKPWNPGLLAVQREVWIQVYGIPIHIWGENLFKMVGAKLGVFLDFDEATASMERFDVARLKILTATWALIDMNLKVEVEGVRFNLWVVEERGKQTSVVVVGGEREDVGSLVVPSEGSDEVEEEFVGVADNSGEDEASGNELDVDMAKNVQHGGRYDTKSDRPMSEQVAKRSDEVLTCEKSTNFSNSQKENMYVAHGYVVNEETVIRQREKGIVLAVSTKVVEACVCSSGGTREMEDKEKIELGGGGPTKPCVSPIMNLGLEDSNPDPILKGKVILGCLEPDPSKTTHVSEEVDLRCSSVSEPEEVAESLKSGGAKSRRRRTKEGGFLPDAEDVGGADESLNINGVAVNNSGAVDGSRGSKEQKAGSVTPWLTPTSGINLISGSQTSQLGSLLRRRMTKL